MGDHLGLSGFPVVVQVVLTGGSVRRGFLARSAAHLARLPKAPRPSARRPLGTAHTCQDPAAFNPGLPLLAQKKNEPTTFFLHTRAQQDEV